MVDVFGTDLQGDWSLNSNGDLNLVTGEANLGQAIKNRLSADPDTYELFYEKYGGVLFDHMGDLNQANIHEYIRIEIEDILSQDPSIRNLTCTVEKNDSKSVLVTLNVTPVGSDEVVELNLILGTDTIILLDVNSGENANRI